MMILFFPLIYYIKKNYIFALQNVLQEKIVLHTI